MAISFHNTVINNLSSSDTTILSSDSSTTITIMGLSLTNTSDNTVMVSVKLTDASSNSSYYLRNALLTGNSSMRVVNGGERLVMGTSNTLTASSNIANCIDCIVSYATQV
jgi:hypothetical protein